MASGLTARNKRNEENKKKNFEIYIFFLIYDFWRINRVIFKIYSFNTSKFWLEPNPKKKKKREASLDHEKVEQTRNKPPRRPPSHLHNNLHLNALMCIYSDGKTDIRWKCIERKIEEKDEEENRVEANFSIGLAKKTREVMT